MNTRANVIVKTVRDPGAVEGPWYAQITHDQWRAFWAVFFGWVVDAFDFNILTFILIDIQRSFTVDRALAGALGTVTLIMRLVGGAVAGTIADRYGRKLPLMLSFLAFVVTFVLTRIVTRMIRSGRGPFRNQFTASGVHDTELKRPTPLQVLADTEPNRYRLYINRNYVVFSRAPST